MSEGRKSFLDRRAEREAEEARAAQWLSANADLLAEDSSTSVDAIAAGDALDVASPAESAERASQALIETDSEVRWGDS